MKEKICIHFFFKDEMVRKEYAFFVPSLGHDIRVGGEGHERYYSVDRVVWVYDEREHPYSRVNIGIVEVT